ncbi:C13 family peptidase [Sphingosinicella sp.]|uniref:C13 family peptidase n=1 Tax=Sphingosinicella sp. TaxID=1917971 RepID=UPI004037A5C9
MRAKLKLIAALALVLPAAASTQTFQAPRHTAGPSPLLVAGSPTEIQRRADDGTQIERGRSPAGELEEHRKLERALAALQPQRAGTVDAYIVVAALDSDPVFGREARVAGEVLDRRYGATGRTIVLAGTDGRAASNLPRGTPATLAIAFARIAELMDDREDVLVLYTTSHGAPFGLYYNDADNGYGAISPNRMAGMLNGLGIRNRLLIISACYAGVFVPRLQSETTAIVTAAAADRSSFGCVAENDWTFFGDAMINRALRQPQPLATAFEQARTLVAGWEMQIRGQPSNPQVSIGANASRWLTVLEARLPPATEPVGRPALERGQAAASR